MKCLKKSIVIIFALAMLLSACGKTPLGATEPNNSGEIAGTIDMQPTEPPPAITTQYLPEKVETPEDIPVLKWVCLTERQYGGGVRTWNESAVLELNKMLEERDMPFRIQFVLLTMDQWLIDSDWFSKPEAQKELTDADLIYGQMRTNDMQEYLMPITEYINSSAEISLANAVPHEYNWLVGTVSNEVYGIPTALYQSYIGGWTMSASFLDKYGLTEEPFLSNFWEMDEILAKIYEQNGQKPFLYVKRDVTTTVSNSFTGETDTYYPGVLYNMVSQCYKGIGSCFAIDYTLDTPTVVNTLQSDNARQTQHAIARYKAAGYITEDTMLVQLSYGTVFGDHPYTGTSGNKVIPNTTAVFHATVAGGPVSGISISSKYKTEALSLLSLIAEDEEFRMQLFYGKEGRDYTVTNGYYEITRYEDGSTYSLDFLSPLSYFSGLISNKATADFLSPGTENWSLFTYDNKTLLETYQSVLENSVLSYPVVFDCSGFGNELKAMEVVYEKYFPDFSKLTEDQYDQMLQELETAGSKKLLDSLQQQLDVWLSEIPNWQ